MALHTKCSVESEVGFACFSQHLTYISLSSLLFPSPPQKTPVSQPAVSRSPSACDPARGCVRPIGTVLSAAGLEVVPNHYPLAFLLQRRRKQHFMHLLHDIYLSIPLEPRERRKGAASSLWWLIRPLFLCRARATHFKTWQWQIKGNISCWKSKLPELLVGRWLLNGPLYP